MEWHFLVLNHVLIAIPFVVAVVLPIFLFYSAWSFYYRPVLAVGAVIWVFAIEAIVVVQPAIPLGVQLFVPDVMFLLIGAAGLFRAFGIRLASQHYLWLLFGLVLLLSFFLGSIKFGTNAGIEFRTFFYFWTGIWYFMTVNITEQQVERIIHIYMQAAAVLVLVALFRWLSMVLELDIVRYWNEGGGSMRVFTAAQTFILGQAFVIGLYAYLNKSGPAWWRGFLPILLICVVLLQHRTIWAVTLVTVALIFWRAGKIRSKAASSLLLAAVIGTAVLLPFFAGGKLETVQNSLAHSVEEVGQEKSTLAWRVQSWQSLLSKWAYGGPVVNLVGNPFGAGFSRFIEAARGEQTQNPHNHYVFSLLRVGLIGIFAMLGTYYVAMRALWNSKLQVASCLVDSNLLMALIAGQLIFFVSYPAQYSQLIPLGMTLALLNRPQLSARVSEA